MWRSALIYARTKSRWQKIVHGCVRPAQRIFPAQALDNLSHIFGEQHFFLNVCASPNEETSNVKDSQQCNLSFVFLDDGFVTIFSLGACVGCGAVQHDVISCCSSTSAKKIIQRARAADLCIFSSIFRRFFLCVLVDCAEMQTEKNLRFPPRLLYLASPNAPRFISIFCFCKRKIKNLTTPSLCALRLSPSLS